jgi:hypothetical protein
VLLTTFALRQRPTRSPQRRRVRATVARPGGRTFYVAMQATSPISTAMSGRYRPTRASHRQRMARSRSPTASSRSAPRPGELDPAGRVTVPQHDRALGLSTGWLSRPIGVPQGVCSTGRPHPCVVRRTIDDWGYVVGLRPQAETIGEVARSRRPVPTLDRCCSSSASVAIPAATKSLAALLNSGPL